MRLLPCLLFALCFGCDDGAAEDPAPDAARAMDAEPEAAILDAEAEAFEVGADAAPDVAEPPDTGPDAQPDAAPDAQCFDPTPLPEARPAPREISPLAGVDEVERAPYETLRDALLADPEVHLVATFDRVAGHYLIERVGARLTFEREGADYRVTEGSLEDFFPSTDAQLYGDLESLLARFENPNELDLQDLGYAAADPRVGFLPPEAQSYPLVLLRIATLFDAPDAPDAVIDLYPWASPSVSTHGSLGLLHSRASLVLSGAGVAPGLLDEVATLPDVAPTVMAALRAPTTAGRSPRGQHDDGLYLRWQDGRPLWSALDPCASAERALIVLFDGLQATELNHLVEFEAELPTLAALVREGAVFRYGAVSGFPSVSAPGHLSVGTGLWQGHHGVLGNRFFGRAEAAVINPFSLLNRVTEILEDPSIAWALYERAVAEEVETLAIALHRAFGAFDPETGEGARVAVLNDLALGGSDVNTIELITEPQQKLGETEGRAADLLAAGQVGTVFRSGPPPKLLQLSFVSTDGIGERDGPHAPYLRESTLPFLDQQLARILSHYEQAGVLDETMIVLVADHGMELQDPARTADLGRVARSGVKTRLGASRLVYFNTMAVEVEGARIRVSDRDSGAPLDGVQVRCGGCPVVEGLTQGGEVELGGAPPSLELSHPNYNPRAWAP